MVVESNFPVLINGRPVDCISSRDRGLLFGDGVFETFAVSDGQPRFWSRHLQRLGAGCRRLGLSIPDEDVLRNEAAALLTGHDAGILKIIVTRGAGGRGYQVSGDAQPTRIVQWHCRAAVPQDYAVNGVRVRLCATRLGSNPQLAGIKHLNRLEQVLARREWNDPEICEGLLLDAEDFVIEGTMSNLFAVQGSTLVTPDLTRSGVAGIMRTVVMELAAGLGLDISVQPLSLAELEQADEVFLTNSLIGVWPVIGLENRSWHTGALTRQLQGRLASLKTEGTAWQQY
jgi:4-amino-4-deoxychorismate lyase